MFESIKNKLIAAMGGLILIGALYGAHSWQVSSLRADVTTANKERDRAVESANALKTANDDFALKIAAQNKELTALRAAGEARAAAAKVKTEAAKVESAKGQAKAAATLKRPMSQPGNACASLDTLLTDAIRNQK